MSFDLQSLIPKHLAQLKPYASARDDFQGGREDRVFLDANELPQALHGLPSYINRYPGNEPSVLKEKLAAVKGVDPEQIFLGNGSDEVIDLVMRSFGRPGKDQVMIFPPTFGIYAVRARVNNLGVRAVDLDSRFLVDTGKALDAFTPETPLMFICHPNNPTGNAQPREKIIPLLEGFRGIVVADEAYIDFSPEKSLLPLLERFPNLMVIQTFSKAFGLAGARVGVAYASTEIIEFLDKVRCPYNLGTASIRLAEQALNSHADLRLNVTRTLRMREQLAEELTRMPLVEKVYPSDANFLLVKTSDANALYSHLARQGVVVRNRNNEPGCRGCLRITIGTAEENQHLVRAWAAFEKKGGVNGLQTARSLTDRDEPTVTGGFKERRFVSGPKARKATHRRTTAETDITLHINLDGTGVSNIHTGIGFFDHMLHQVAKHGMIDLEIIARGDLEVDCHHTIEDTGITLGTALLEALGDKRGVERYGFTLPMDDSEASVLLDLGNRFYLKWDARFDAKQIGNIPSGMFRHFFRSFAEAAKCNLHVKATGDDDHHKTEAIFKAFARTLRMAVSRNDSDTMPTTKGML